MSFYTASSLRQYVQNRQSQSVKMTRNALRKSITEAVELSIFLSHSHEDLEQYGSDMVDVVKKFLGDLSVDVYIDAYDPDMPSITSGATAEALKERIARCDILVLAATERAVASRWVPWEVGFADGSKGAEKVAVLPILDRSSQWNGSEYLQIYRQIQPAASGNPALFYPGATRGTRFQLWAESI